ncbi:MAG: class I SAM-dependent methyltransferase [Variovorax sp.]
MAVLPPGTRLHLMYLEERLKLLPPGRFLEIGPGSGEITQLLLDKGWSGKSFDLEEQTIAKLNERFHTQLADRRFTAVNENFLSTVSTEHSKVDLVISCMVMEHLEDASELKFMSAARDSLVPRGMTRGPLSAA